MSQLSNHQHRIIRNAAAGLAPPARAAFYSNLIRRIHHPRHFSDVEIAHAVRLALRHVAKRAFILAA
ncbi:hypothetical protein Q2941_17405 [Bradyrhizobium sp. UFLA05-153]